MLWLQLGPSKVSIASSMMRVQVRVRVVPMVPVVVLLAVGMASTGFSSQCVG